MEAVVTKEFPGRPDSEMHVRTIKVGETITGDLARVAVDEKWAKAKGGKAEQPANPLAKLTVAELNAMAQDKGIDVSMAGNKAEIIELLDKAQA
jgi:hypothetical protein